MKTLSVTLIVLFCVVGSSYAFEIVSMESSDGTYTYYSDSGYITHSAEVETDDAFAEVDWYVNNVWQTTTKGDGVKKTASFSKGFSGHGPGKHYWIKAIAYSDDGESDSDSYEIHVYKNVVAYSGGWSNDLGYAEVAKCEFDGTRAWSSQYASVNNYTDDSVNVIFTFWFKVLHNDSNDDLVNQLYVSPVIVNPAITVEAGETNSDSFSDSYTLPPMNPQNPWWDPGDYIILEVQSTVDVVDGTIWDARASARYEFPRIE